MTELSLDQVAKRTGGQIVQGSPSLAFSVFNIDSRKTVPGELFFAIVSRRNGHEFVNHALKRGALGAVISHDLPSLPEKAAIIRVKNTLKSLQKLAHSVIQERQIKVIGITGSNGKTTTKEFTSHLLSSSYHVLKSEGNYNNHLGLPLTLLKMNESHEVAVLEMGMSSPGEIKVLTQIAPPDIAVITNVNPVHLEFFSSLEEIAMAKKEILDGMKKGGTAVLNRDDPLVRKMGEGLPGEKIFFGFSPGCDIRAQNIEHKGFEGLSFMLDYGGKRKKVNFPFLYESYLYNLLASLGVAFALSLPFEKLAPLIDTLKPFSMRGTVITLDNGIKLIDDSYNSNPAALESALKGLSELPSKRKIAVLGDMLELGEKEAQFHLEAGTKVAKYKWDILVGIGRLSRNTIEGAVSAGMRKQQTYLFQDSGEAARKIVTLINKGDLILVKGSRGIKTDKIVDEIKKRFKKK